MQLHDTPIGTAIEGGFFGGIINVAGQHKAIIWAPRTEGLIIEALMPGTQMVEGAGSPNDCHANTVALLAAGSPAAQRITALTIGGFNDWLIPSRDVLELGYRHFKPTTYSNYCSWRDGENANSVPPGWLYTSDTPAKTELEAFQEGGTEAFDPKWHWSSTVLPAGNAAFSQGFSYGRQLSRGLSSEGRVRAVRLIQLNP